MSQLPRDTPISMMGRNNRDTGHVSGRRVQLVSFTLSDAYTTPENPPMLTKCIISSVQPEWVFHALQYKLPPSTGSLTPMSLDVSGGFDTQTPSHLRTLSGQCPQLLALHRHENVRTASTVPSVLPVFVHKSSTTSFGDSFC